MKERAVLAWFDAALAECRDNVKDLRDQSKIMQERYLCKLKEKGKREFNVMVPYTKPKTKRAVNIIKSTLLKAPDYLDFDTPVRSPDDPRYLMDIKRCNYTKRLVKAHLDAEPCSFITRFCESLEAALGYAKVMVLKFWVGYHDLKYMDVVAQELVQDRRLALKCKAIDPEWFDFSMDGSIQIEHEFVTMPELWELVDEGLFEEKRVAKLNTGDYGKEISEDRKEWLVRMGLNESSNPYRKDVMLSHFWGPLINKDNQIVEKNVRFTVANEQYMLTPVLENPYPDKSTPYVYDSVLKVPFRHVGKSLTEDVVSIENAINDFVNIQLDNLLWRMLGVNEVDSMALDPKLKEDLKNLYPGKLIMRRTGVDKLAFTHHELGSDPNQAMGVLQELKALADSDHGVTEFISAGVASSETSATEQNQKRTDAMAQFEGFATDLESNFFVKCIDKARDLIIQYMADPFSDPKAQDIIGQEGIELEMLTEDQRKELIVSEYNIKARGLSIYFDRMKKQNVYTGVYKIINALPPEGKAEVNWRFFMKNAFITLGLDNPDEALKSPEQIEKDKKEMAMMQQKAMEMEIQKVMAPLQAKIKQTEMGISERMQIARERMQAEFAAAKMKLEQSFKQDMMKAMRDDKKSAMTMQAAFERDMMKIRADMDKKLLEMESAERDRIADMKQTILTLKAEMKSARDQNAIDVLKIAESSKAAMTPKAINVHVGGGGNGGSKPKSRAKKQAAGEWVVEEVKEKPPKKKFKKAEDGSWEMWEIESEVES